jgi:hypothetical protein
MCGRRTPSHSSPFARWSVSRWTPRPALSQRRDEALDLAVELLREAHEPGEVGLPRLLPLAELVRRLREEAVPDGELAHDLGSRSPQAAERLEHLPSRVACEQRRALERDRGVMERLLELGRARVRPHEDRHLLERKAVRVQLPNVCADVQARPQGRLRPLRKGRRERLRRTAEPRHEAVGELEHLRRRAVAPLEPHDVGVREALRQREQPASARAREAVDRLVVVADRAELVPLAEPEVEQRLLEEVDVLVLIHGEGAPALVYRRPSLLVLLEQPHSPLEQVLEVE